MAERYKQPPKKSKARPVKDELLRGGYGMVSITTTMAKYCTSRQHFM